MILPDDEELNNYITSSKDQAIKKWWAQNAESHGDLETAHELYTDINEIQSIVRLHCRNGNLKAVLIYFITRL